jgi:hypothetical protein
MKGTLHKTDEGWIVRYIQEDPRDPLPELPLHPEYQTILPLDLDLEGKEVEFDWCVIVEHYTGKGKEYAKLIQPREKISDESWEGCDGCTEQDEIMYKSGYVKGYNAAIAELPKEISDEEIKEMANESKSIFKEDMYRTYFIMGAKWYREQLKSKI